MGVETLLIASLASTAVGAGVSAYGQAQQGRAQQALSDRNAAVATQDALDVQSRGRLIANDTRRQGRALLGKQRVLQAAGGVVTGTGTPLLLQVQQAGEIQRAAIMDEQEANQQASRLRQQAILDRMEGKSARRAGNIGAAATILQGTASGAGTFSNYRMYKGA